jgi:hypothetical protein
LDPAGTCSGGKRRHHRLPSAIVGAVAGARHPAAR